MVIRYLDPYGYSAPLHNKPLSFLHIGPYPARSPENITPEICLIALLLSSSTSPLGLLNEDHQYTHVEDAPPTLFVNVNNRYTARLVYTHPKARYEMKPPCCLEPLKLDPPYVSLYAPLEIGIGAALFSDTAPTSTKVRRLREWV